MKLKIKVNIDGPTCLNASHKSAVVSIFAVDGILISMINNVNAIANTPSQKASSLELGFVSDIACHAKIAFFLIITVREE